MGLERARACAERGWQKFNFLSHSPSTPPPPLSSIALGALFQHKIRNPVKSLKLNTLLDMRRLWQSTNCNVHSPKL